MFIPLQWNVRAGPLHFRPPYEQPEAPGGGEEVEAGGGEHGGEQPEASRGEWAAAQPGQGVRSSNRAQKAQPTRLAACWSSLSWLRNQQLAQKEKMLEEEVEEMKATLSCTEEGRARASAHSRQMVSEASVLSGFFRGFYYLYCSNPYVC